MPLVDTGLVVRFPFDDAASGTGPTAVADISGNGYDLDTIDYGPGNLSYTEVSGNRGLESTATSGDQLAKHAITSSDVIDTALNDSKTATLEYVVRVDSFTGNSRIFGLTNRVGGAGTFIVRGSGSNWRVMRNNSTMLDGITWDLSTRAVVHVVFNSALGTESDRVRVYVDNVEDTSGTVSLTQNSVISVGPGSTDLIALNREASGSFNASFDGELFYAAIYEGALSAADRTTNFNILIVDDDSPAAGGGRIMSSLARYGGLAGAGGIAGYGGGLAA